MAYLERFKGNLASQWQERFGDKEYPIPTLPRVVWNDIGHRHYDHISFAWQYSDLGSGGNMPPDIVEIRCYPQDGGIDTKFIFHLARTEGENPLGYVLREREDFERRRINYYHPLLLKTINAEEVIVRRWEVNHIGTRKGRIECRMQIVACGGLILGESEYLPIKKKTRSSVRQESPWLETHRSFFFSNASVYYVERDGKMLHEKTVWTEHGRDNGMVLVDGNVPLDLGEAGIVPF